MADSVARLKELLFETESAALSDLSRRVEEVTADVRRSQVELGERVQRSDSEREKLQSDVGRRLEEVFQRAGSEERLRASVAGVLEGALRKAEVEHHEAMAGAIAPLVVRTIRTELVNNQDTLLQALYPLTGRMVKAYIATAMRDLMDDINRRLEQNWLTLRIKSLRTGRSVRELVLAETQRLSVDEVLLIKRGSGELLQHWPKAVDPAGSGQQKSAVLAAINEFAGNAFRNDGGGLRSLMLEDGTRVFLRASPAFLLAARCRGQALKRTDGLLDEAFLTVMEQQGVLDGSKGSLAVPRLLADFKANLDSRIDAQYAEIAAVRLPFNPLKAMAAVILLPLLVWGGWLAFTSLEVANARSATQRVIDATPALTGYPVRVDIGPRGRSVALQGLAPSELVRTDLIDRLQHELPGVELHGALAVLPTPSADPEPLIASVRRTLASMQSEFARTQVQRTLERGGRRLEQAIPALQHLRQSLPDASQRTQAAMTAEAVADANRELTTLRDLAVEAAGASADPASRQFARTRLEAAAGRLSEQANRIAALLFGTGDAASTSPAPVSPTPIPASVDDVAAAAEDLTAQADLVASIALAAVQASAIRPPPVVAPTATPRDRLQTFTLNNAVFFGDGVEYRSSDVADATIAELAGLMQATNDIVRVVGYTDERGGAVRNTPLSQGRADRVAARLVELGIPRERLVSIGRAQGRDLSPAVGTTSTNRRVEFELGFIGEAAAAQ